MSTNPITSEFWDSLCRRTVSSPPTSGGTIIRPPRLPSVMPCVVAIAGLIIEGLRPILIVAVISAPLLAADHYTRRPLMLLAASVILVMLWMKARYHVGSESIHPGVYGHFTTSAVGRRVEQVLRRALERHHPTPYLFNAHLRTLILHVLMYGSPPPQGLQRRWFPVEGQHIALDVLLPKGSPKGVVLLLHGLNGDTNEPYVIDMYKACQGRGFIGCGMLGRGLAGSPFNGGPRDTFSPGRISDVLAVVKMLHSCTSLPVYLVGWSLGGVIAANLVARLWEMFDSKCAVELWHPILAFELKRSLLWRMVSLTGYEPEPKDWYYTCNDLLQVEAAVGAPAHGFDSVWDYYRAMSADDEGKCRDIAVPTLIVHAVDDPVMHVDLAGPKYDDGRDDSSQCLFAVITSSGGHLGFPQGWTPWTTGFGWISDTALDFADAVMSSDHHDD
ncbi:Phospholipase abhd3 [Perkinsus olseni]|uniref:Phospholipase abhd3 n=1 Tax=Perkinsus olseni TaxID=32597 RepID=A0A7J6P3X2_PEROL|nr:Phospholipase abhd3 [Perkinsus olseni]